MEATGERLILGTDLVDEADYYIYLLHLATYNFALPFVKNKNVLDYGCGSGYGSQMLALEASSIVAVDISKDAIDFASKNYPANNIDFKTLNQFDNIPENKKFDVITSFQVIEHISDENKYIERLKNLLKPGGYLIISTPDKTSRLVNMIQKPWNIFHIKEYSSRSLFRLLNKYFREIKVLKITSKPEFVEHELIRRKKQKYITLPCTLFFYPYFLRVFLLKLQARLYGYLSFLKRKIKKIPLTQKINLDNPALKYTITDIEISENPENPTDLLVVCRLVN